MPDPIRFPISNHLTHNLFTLTLAVGSAPAQVNIILDTGSTMLTISGDMYDAAQDPKAQTTQILQTEEFVTGTAAAAVVRTPVGLEADGHAVAITVPDTTLAVVRDPAPGLFGRADGILGLAYPALGKTYQMPANTWTTSYTIADIMSGRASPSLGTYLDQLVAKGLAANIFAFAVRRSVASQVEDAAARDTANTGVFVLGGGPECTDLYNGSFSSLAVTHEEYYAVALTAIRVGTKTITVPAAAPGGPAPSNTIIDSGVSDLMLNPTLYQQVIAQFNAIDPTFGPLITTCSSNGSATYDQTQMAAAKWPSIRFTFQAAGGGQASVTVSPRDYWQADSAGPGRATCRLVSSGTALGGRSILGLPLFANNYVIFDRTGGPGRGAIRFANAATPAAPLVA
jgi:hypothetical protein